jgi:hypothetical protein
LLPVAAPYKVPVLLNVRAFMDAGKLLPIRLAAPVLVLMLYRPLKEMPYKLPFGSNAISVRAAPEFPTSVAFPVATSTLPMRPAESSIQRIGAAFERGATNRRIRSAAERH